MRQALEVLAYAKRYAVALAHDGIHAKGDSGDSTWSMPMCSASMPGAHSISSPALNFGCTSAGLNRVDQQLRDAGRQVALVLGRVQACTSEGQCQIGIDRLVISPGLWPRS